MKALKFILPATLLAAGTVSACDLCNVYSALSARGDIERGWVAGAAEQFTHFGTLQLDGVEVPNPDRERLDSSITQVVLGYNFSSRFGVQFNLPLIHRSFRRVEDTGVVNGSESGIGDAALLAHFQIYDHEGKNSTFNWYVLGGVKFPTGNASRLGEEAAEHTGGEEGEGVEPEEPHSGIHGHDLALGSGSVDGIIGTGIFARWHRWFFNANVQYALRSSGEFGYRFADDLTWTGGPGVFLVLKDEFTLRLQAVVSGETKGLDDFQGIKADDTGITSVFVGPQVSLSWKDRVSFEAGVELPVLLNNTALQMVPDYRIRSAFTVRF